MLRNWAKLEQVYHVKVKGMLTLADLERLGKEIGVRMQTVRQPDATRGRAANYWYEVRMRDTKKEELRRVLFKEKHPLEKLKRIGLGHLTVEGIPRGRYRMIAEKRRKSRFLASLGMTTFSVRAYSARMVRPSDSSRETKPRKCKNDCRK